MGSLIRGKGLKYLIADSAFKRMHVEEMNVRVAVLVREQRPLGQCQQFRQESVAHWDAARACRGLGLPDVPATDAFFAVEARLLPNEDFLRAGIDVGGRSRCATSMSLHPVDLNSRTNEFVFAFVCV